MISGDSKCEEDELESLHFYFVCLCVVDECNSSNAGNLIL